MTEIDTRGRGVGFTSRSQESNTFNSGSIYQPKLVLAGRLWGGEIIDIAYAKEVDIYSLDRKRKQFEDRYSPSVLMVGASHFGTYNSTRRRDILSILARCSSNVVYIRDGKFAGPDTEESRQGFSWLSQSGIRAFQTERGRNLAREIETAIRIFNGGQPFDVVISAFPHLNSELMPVIMDLMPQAARICDADNFKSRSKQEAINFARTHNIPIDRIPDLLFPDRPAGNAGVSPQFETQALYTNIHQVWFSSHPESQLLESSVPPIYWPQKPDVRTVGIQQEMIGSIVPLARRGSYCDLVGNFKNSQNQIALAALAVASQHISSDIRFEIVGKDASSPQGSSFLQSWVGNDDRFRIHGIIDDEAMLRIVANSFVSMSLGPPSGVQLKAIKALSLGTPVVMLRESAVSNNIPPDIAIVVDSIDEVGKRVDELRASPQEWLRRSEKGLKLVSQRHNPEHLEESIIDALQKALMIAR